MRLIVFVLTLSSLAIIPTGFAQALGMSPPIIQVPGLLTSSSTTQQVSISRTEPDPVDIVMDVNIYGNGAEYITSEDTFILPSGKQSAYFEFTINTEGAPIGDYEANLQLTTADVGTDVGTEEDTEDVTVGASMVVTSGLTPVVRFTVSGEQHLEYDVTGFGVKDTEIEQNIYMSYYVANVGNVDWKPERIDISFENVDDPEQVFETTLTEEEIEHTKAFTSLDYEEVISYELPIGDYVATADFVYKDESITLQSQQFTVFPKGTLAQDGELLSIRTNKEQYAEGENIKLEASFENTGEISVEGVLITEVYLNDSLIDLLRSETLVIDNGEEQAFSQLLNLSESGLYTLSSYVEFGNKKSAVKSTEITISSETVSNTMMFVILGVASACILGASFAIRIIRRKKTNA